MSNHGKYIRDEKRGTSEVIMYTPFTKILSVKGTQLKIHDDHIFTRFFTM